MRNLPRALREHLPVIAVVTLLTLAMTFPTIVYVFRTDVFWLPTGKDHDVFVKLWDVWYGGQVLTGKADRFHTDLIYYPKGVSLVNHPIFLAHSIVVSALQAFLPLSNAYNLAFLLIVSSSAGSAYLYIHWLFKDKWIALFGAVVFGFSPQVTGHPAWPDISWIAPLPLVLYCAHRGVRERRALLVILAGLLTGMTSESHLYFFVIVVMTLGLVLGAMCASRWRDGVFWRQTVLLIAAVAISSAWRVIPVLQHPDALDTALGYYGEGERLNDIMSFFVNPRHPILGPLGGGILQTPAYGFKHHFSKISYLGFLPLLLIAIGFYGGTTRRKMLPWLGLGLVFVFLHLGSTLYINGIAYENIKLPKHYLNQLLPPVFAAYHRTNYFMAGICLPLAVLACFGLASLKERIPSLARPRMILALALIVAFEYYLPPQEAPVDPITGQPFSQERLAFLDWLKGEETDEIRLINLPFERNNAKVYLLYQSLSGFPQTEGGISRPPPGAYDYIRENSLLNAWYNHRPSNCVISAREVYKASVTRLLDDGFSHIVFHHGFYFWQNILESFRYLEPAYRDDYVSIYRLGDALQSCPNRGET